MRSFTYAELKKMHCSKEQLSKYVGLKNITFDYAMPQQWLNMIADDNKDSEFITYDLIRSTTFWVYEYGHGHPVSGCTEVTEAITAFTL